MNETKASIYAMVLVFVLLNGLGATVLFWMWAFSRVFG